MEKSAVQLFKNGVGLVDAELWDDISEEHVELWRDTWVPANLDALDRLKRSEIPKESWPRDLHWNWNKKRHLTKDILAYKRFAITCQQDLQGLMLINLTKTTCRIESQKGKDLAYIELLSTAPWNRKDLLNEPKFSLVGSIMIRAAIAVSEAEGFRGRIGLHSLDQARTFYSERCGMTEFGFDENCENLSYFEMSESDAAEFAADPEER